MLVKKYTEEETGRQAELSKQLAELSKAYYNTGNSMVDDAVFDKLRDELSSLEKESGFAYDISPNVSVGAKAEENGLKTVAHEYPALSLDKVKYAERNKLVEWLGTQDGVLSWKMDGLTVVLTYEDGVLAKAVTRGNGEIGEVITPNARTFINIPTSIPYKGQLILRGEAVISYSDFEKLNDSIADVDAKYKNPRNLCSGSVRQLNSEITASRNVRFMAFALVRADGVDFKNSRKEQFLWLSGLGFETVEFVEVTAETLSDAVRGFAEKIEHYDIPSDGLVLLYDDIAYGQSLGRTAKFPRDSIAFKWADEIQETTLSYIEWSASRTGLINPVAVFEPVELEGTTVSRASVHNISIMEGLELGAGDQITVYKANMIIPQIADNLTRSGVRDIPKICPVCGGETEIRQINDVKALYCTNPDCQAKKIKSFTLFVSRDALNIDGLSEATLEKFIGAGFIHEFADIFHLDRHKDAIVSMEGFGEKSYENLIQAVKRAASTNLVRVVYGLGIAGIGLANAKMLCRHFHYNFDAMRHASVEELTTVDGIGAVLADAWCQYFADEKNNAMTDHLLAELTLEEVKEEEGDRSLDGMVFVITGSVEHFANRKELQTLIESKGGKATGSVTSKTTYLINNDVNSTSSKNKKARELGIPILSEEDFLKLLEGEKHAD